MDTYRIVRFYRDGDIRRRVIDTGLTLEDVQAHCDDPGTSSTTATTPTAKERTRKYGAWFDGFEKE